MHDWVGVGLFELMQLGLREGLLGVLLPSFGNLKNEIIEAESDG